MDQLPDDVVNKTGSYFMPLGINKRLNKVRYNNYPVTAKKESHYRYRKYKELTNKLEDSKFIYVYGKYKKIDTLILNFIEEEKNNTDKRINRLVINCGLLPIKNLNTINSLKILVINGPQTDIGKHISCLRQLKEFYMCSDEYMHDICDNISLEILNIIYIGYGLKTNQTCNIRNLPNLKKISINEFIKCEKQDNLEYDHSTLNIPRVPYLRYDDLEYFDPNDEDFENKPTISETKLITITDINPDIEEITLIPLTNSNNIHYTYDVSNLFGKTTKECGTLLNKLKIGINENEYKISWKNNKLIEETSIDLRLLNAAKQKNFNIEDGYFYPLKLLNSK
jgi:hypothetical protein